MKALANDFNHFFVQKVEKIHDSFNQSTSLSTVDSNYDDFDFDPLHTFKLATLVELKDILLSMTINLL